jgi:anhydro-N-acetylmuramic acid kinase
VNRILFARPKRTIAVLNLGGIANLSIIPPRLSRRHVVGTDCGPANVLLDLAARTHLGRPQDPSGRHAMQGEIEGPFLTALKRNTWFKRSLPASCGREEFNEDFLSKAVKKGNVQHSADLLATLCAFSAWGVQRALRELDAVPHTIFASGGGVHNVRLMAEIEEAVAPIPLQSATRLGVHPDALEAVSFALLGYMSVRRKAIDLRGATGARRPAVLGRVTWP